MNLARSDNSSSTVALTTQALGDHPCDTPIVTPDALAATDIAEAEAAAAQARVVAVLARARATRLRQDATTAHASATDDPSARAEEDSSVSPSDDTSVANSVEAKTEEAACARRRWLRTRRLRRPSWTTAVATGAVLVIGGGAAATGYMWWQHHEFAQERQRSAEFAAAARQGVVNLMSLNFNNADGDVQRLISNTTDDFRKDLESGRGDFISVVRDSKVVTTGTVSATAVESMSTKSAVVLVAATLEVTNTAGAKQDPRTWRLAVTITGDAGQLKMSKVEFVP